MKSFNATAHKIWEELGCWAADFYISEVVNKVLTLAGQSDNSLSVWDLPSAEKNYLANALRRVDLNPDSKHSSGLSMQTTDKVETMINVLLQSAGPLFSGIVFVQVRFW